MLSRRVRTAVETRWRAATVEHIAINAVLAGCKPEYVPVVIAAVEGWCVAGGIEPRASLLQPRANRLPFDRAAADAGSAKGGTKE